MNKLLGWLAMVCLAVGFTGCQTDEVQTGYLTPQQSASAPAPAENPPQTADSSPAASESSAERLPAPSATQSVSEDRAEAPEPKEEAKAEVEEQSAPAPRASEASDSTPQKMAVSSRTRGSSPPAENRATASVGGKLGQQKQKVSKWQESRFEDREEPERVSREPEDRDEPEVARAQRDEDQDEETKPRPSAVSSSFQPTQTRIYEPQGNAKGVVVRTNAKAKFAVVKFQFKAFPAVGKVLSVLRNGEKVGQIRITKPVKPPHATGDVIEGDVRIGDTVE